MRQVGFRAYTREAAMNLNVYNQFTYTLETIIQAGTNKTKIETVKIHSYPDTRKSRLFKNIPEYRQPRVIYSLLKVYKPDILVVTGHDGMIKKGTGFYDLYNYRNSRYFVETVKEARRYDKEEGKNLVIFARSMSKLL